MIDGDINAWRGEMERGMELTWRGNAPLARDLTGTWAAAAAAATAAPPWAPAILIANAVSICHSVLFWGALILLQNRKLSQKHRRNCFLHFEVAVDNLAPVV